MNEIRILTADQVEKARLTRFLDKVYRKKKSEFLRDHGSWFHRGDKNRLVAMRGDEIVAYCATTPVKILLKGVERRALWGIDMIVAPEYRGKGYQTVLDRKLQELGGMKIAFPNQLHAAIVRKHGWGVREDLRYLLLPLVPERVKHVVLSKGMKGFFLRTAARMSAPAASLMRRRFTCYRPVTARREASPDPIRMASVFDRFNRDDRLMTTCRDEEFLRWRYCACSYLSDLSFYAAGPSDAPTHILISRLAESGGIKVARFLDIFGDFHDRKGLRDIIKLAIRDSVTGGVAQITVLDSVPELVSVLRSLGFLFSMKVRFCWFSSSGPEKKDAGESACYWTMADSDNDTPE